MRENHQKHAKQKENMVALFEEQAGTKISIMKAYSIDN